MNDDLRIAPSHAVTRTEKARAEGELAPLAGEDRLSSFYAGCPVALFTTTPEGRFVDANRAFARLLGYADHTHFLDLPVPSFYCDPRKRQEIMGILDREGAVHGHEVEFVRLDGTRVWVSITARAIRDATGRAVRYEGALEDVTPRRRAQDMLRLSDQRFHFLAKATNDIVWDWDFAAGTVWWNENFERAFGYRLDELEPGPESWMGRIHPDDIDRVSRGIHDAIDGAATTWSDEYRFRRADGEYATIYDRGLVLRDGAGQAMRMVGSMMDNTLQRQQQILLGWQRKVLEMIALHQGLEETLEVLCRDAEELSAGRRFTVLLASDDGRRLLHGAAPSLPASYNKAVHGLLIGPCAGSCGTAAHRRAPVVVEDIATDPLWADFRHLALPLGLRACWSTPILSSKGEVLGTWAVYRPSPGAPTPADDEVVRVATRLAAIAIERAGAERALRESREQLAKAQEVAHLGSWSWDVAAGKLDWSEEQLRIHGLPVEDGGVQPDAALACVHPEDRSRVAAELEALLWRAGSGEMTYRIVRPDGATRWIHARTEVDRAHDGTPARMLGTCHDITEQRRAQRALQEKEERLRAALDASATGTFRWDPATNELDWDENLDRLFGLPAGSTARHIDQFTRLVHPDDRERVHEALDRCVHEGADFDLEFRVVWPDGSVHWLLDRGRMLRDADGRPLTMTGACTDVTVRMNADLALRQRADELARLTEALQRMNRELDQFAYITSHDLKAPLRGIANLSQWIEDDEHEHLSEQSKRNLELLRNRVQRMDALIDAILAYSRVGRVRVPTEVVAVGPLIEEVVDLLSPPVGFRVEIAAPLPSVVAERTLLQQVFMNLLGNAIKHHRDKESGRAVVSCADAGSHWRFTVADNGPGISPRFHDKIFVIFQTLEARDRSEGTGVGLALVKKIVESSGGAVALDSDVGRGAAFSFTWPKGLV
ncbi:PAS domain-containing protein [Sorangium sp. So ce1078]|uniref:PAS domain-containing protein n=1 Tax=Sorangium sp. So ce1078 TaxID=3133329 RepID=UPI003F61FE47